jgi:hypothetical protein
MVGLSGPIGGNRKNLESSCSCLVQNKQDHVTGSQLTKPLSFDASLKVIVSTVL